MNKTSLFHEISKRHLLKNSNVPVGLLFLLTVFGLIFILFVVALVRHIRTKSSSSITGPLNEGPYIGPYIIQLDSPPSYEDIIKEARICKVSQNLPPTYEQSLAIPKSTANSPC